MNGAYSDSYEAARTKFRGRCDGLNWLHSAHATEHPGLTIDVASSPNPGAKTLIITSGLHGIEGFFGSAVQCELMAQLASGALAIPAGCALVLVHALNPFGFANLRRTDAANVDLNRNFLLPQQSFTGAHKDYHLLHPLLNPQHQPRGFDLFLVHMLLKSWRMGRRHIKDAVASGQYEYPTGLFYGGSAPSPTSRLLDDLLPKWIPPGTESAVHVDLHSGLGRYATPTLLTHRPANDVAQNWIQTWPGAQVQALGDAAIAYPARGTFTEWITHRQQVRNFLAVGLEFGTYSPLRVLSALRCENACHHYLPEGHPQLIAAKQRLYEMFCPADSEWRRKVLQHSLEFVKFTTTALAAD